MGWMGGRANSAFPVCPICPAIPAIPVIPVCLVCPSVSPLSSAVLPSPPSLSGRGADAGTDGSFSFSSASRSTSSFCSFSSAVSRTDGDGDGDGDACRSCCPTPILPPPLAPDTPETPETPGCGERKALSSSPGLVVIAAATFDEAEEDDDDVPGATTDRLAMDGMASVRRYSAARACTAAFGSICARVMPAPHTGQLGRAGGRMF